MKTLICIINSIAEKITGHGIIWEDWKHFKLKSQSKIDVCSEQIYNTTKGLYIACNFGFGICSDDDGHIYTFDVETA